LLRRVVDVLAKRGGGREVCARRRGRERVVGAKVGIKSLFQAVSKVDRCC
jgi:hypothetical protein